MKVVKSCLVRGGDYYLVKAGLKEGELVVTNGNFKLDSALQISAKPSMMTPEGGGGVGSHHHGGESKPAADGKPMQMEGHAAMNLPPHLATQLHQTIESSTALGKAIESADLKRNPRCVYCTRPTGFCHRCQATVG